MYFKPIEEGSALYRSHNARLADMISAVGTGMFKPELEAFIGQEINARAFVCRLAAGGPELLSDHPDISVQAMNKAWCERHYANDPAMAQLSLGLADGLTSFRTDASTMHEDRFRWTWMTSRGYTARLSFVWKDKGDVLKLAILSCGAQSGDVTRWTDLARVLLPLVLLHLRLTGDIACNTQVTSSDMEDRIASSFPQLTTRERQVCARSIIGVTAEGIALDLDIKQTSVLTYRRRAYARLNINSINQLSSMLIRSRAAA